MNIALLTECRTSADRAINMVLLNGVQNVVVRRRTSLEADLPVSNLHAVACAANHALRYQAF